MTPEHLFQNATANGTSDKEIVLDLRAGQMNRTVAIFGTFDGATVELLAVIDGTEITIPDSTTTTATIYNLYFRVPKIRAKISGAGASTNLNVVVI